MEGLGRSNIAGGMISIKLNGRPHSTSATTLAELAAELSPAPQTLLFEWNREAVSMAQWESARLAESDAVEVLRISAGG